MTSYCKWPNKAGSPFSHSRQSLGTNSHWSNMATRGWLFLFCFVLIVSVCYGKKKVTKEVRICVLNVMQNSFLEGVNIFQILFNNFSQ